MEIPTEPIDQTKLLPESPLKPRKGLGLRARWNVRREKAGEKIRLRRQQIDRTMELRRLKRLRRKTVPAYSRCMNCGTELRGMYCHHCGQYALDIKQSFWKFIKQYFENVYQFDSKVWSTLYLLFRRPGFLTREFNAGKINSYVHPFRLYMFLSILFFILAFAILPDYEDLFLKTAPLHKALSKETHAELARQKANGLLRDTTIRIKIDSAVLFTGLTEYIRNTTPSGEKNKILEVTLPVLLLDSCRHIISKEEKRDFYTYQQTRLLTFDSEMENDESVEKGKRVYSYMMGWLRSWLPLILMLFIPFFAFMLRIFFRKENLKYIFHFVFGLHIHSIMLITYAAWLSTILLWPDSVPTPALTISICYLTLFMALMVISVYQAYPRSGWIKSTIKSLLIWTIYILITAIVIVTILLSLLFNYFKHMGFDPVA